jgi:hypothetical protein
MTSELRHPLAVTSDGKIVTPMTHTNDEKITCICGCNAPLGIRRPSGIPGRRAFRHHFFYLKGTQTNCELRTGGNGKETMQHIRAKQYLADNVNRLRIRTLKCFKCGTEEMTNLGPEAVARIEVCADGSRLRPDIIIETKLGDKWALEVFHTHVSGKDRNYRLQNMGYNVAEFRALTVIDRFERNLDDSLVILDDNLAPLMCLTCYAKQQEHWAKEKLKREEKEEKEMKEKSEKEEEQRQRKRKNAIAMETASDLLEERLSLRRKNEQHRSYVCCTCLSYSRATEGSWLEQKFYCRECFMSCVECGDYMPLLDVVQYGRCLKCNLKGTTKKC